MPTVQKPVLFLPSTAPPFLPPRCPPPSLSCSTLNLYVVLPPIARPPSHILNRSTECSAFQLPSSPFLSTRNHPTCHPFSKTSSRGPTPCSTISPASSRMRLPP